ncbi:nicotinamide riboside kinase-like protein 2 [Morchella snyderi]|nr:nicotinamide riboside kinase-like protein 2 [Morchella snyderi]
MAAVPPSPPPPLLLGLSGLSNSGKTTLSRLLRRVFPGSFILHQDDFFVTESGLPIVDGDVDYDCVESIDFVGLKKALGHIREHGELPGDLVSREDQNSVGESGVGDEVVEECVARVREAGMGAGRARLAVVDGFLLFHDEEVLGMLDLGMFLRAPYDKAKQRREARTGYVTIEGFWEDPPGYFDKIVWPNYVKAHKHLFIDGDVSGTLDPEVMKTKNIVSPPEVDMHMSKILPWAVDVILHAVKRKEALAAK